MGLLSFIATLPLAPVRGVISLAELIQRQVEEELHNPASARRASRGAGGRTCGRRDLRRGGRAGTAGHPRSNDRNGTSHRSGEGVTGDGRRGATTVAGTRDRRDRDA